MSLSKPRLENPCRTWIRFKGSSGQFVIWDKEQQKEVEKLLPLKFIVLDELSKISGYHNSTRSGIFSNEVRSTKKEMFDVRVWKGSDQITGYYQDIKDKIKSIGGKYTKSVYVALTDGNGGLELANFELRGAAFSEWLNFSKKKDWSKLIVSIGDIAEDSKGSISYKIPKFGMLPMDKHLLDEAMKMDKQLQRYLEKRAEVMDDEPDDDAEDLDDFPDDDETPAKPQPEMSTKEAAVSGTLDMYKKNLTEEPKEINLSDEDSGLPF